MIVFCNILKFLTSSNHAVSREEMVKWVSQHFASQVSVPVERATRSIIRVSDNILPCMHALLLQRMDEKKVIRAAVRAAKKLRQEEEEIIEIED